MHALLLAIHRDIMAKKPSEELAKWKTSALSVTLSFELHEQADMFYWQAVNLREDLVTDDAEMSRTGLRRILDIANYKHAKNLPLASFRHRQ